MRAALMLINLSRDGVRLKAICHTRQVGRQIAKYIPHNTHMHA